MPDFKRGPWVRFVLFFVGIFIVVLIVRYLLVRDLDFGFSLVMAILVVLIYFLIKRLLRYIRSKEVGLSQP